MFNIIGIFGEYYYVIFILQAWCVYHSIRNGSQGKWILLIVFLPLVGCLIYLFTEVLNKTQVSSIQSDVAKLVNPGGRIKELEKKFHFSGTFANRVALADAFLAKRMNEKAIELYEPALTGLFESNEHVLEKLIDAYYNVGRLDDVIRIAPKLSKKLNFNKSKANLLYAFSLEKTGQDLQAEQEFKAMNCRFSNYEARYNYGLFLLRRDRKNEADLVFDAVINEGQQMSRKEIGESKIWIDKVIEESKKISV
jgi:hypothetical protein